MERFAKIVNGFLRLTIFAKRSIFDVWKGCEYASELVGAFHFKQELKPRLM